MAKFGLHINFLTLNNLNSEFFKYKFQHICVLKFNINMRAMSLKKCKVSLIPCNIIVARRNKTTC